MRIRQLVWPDDRVEHIAKHGVTPEEVESVCFGEPLVLSTASHGKNPVYQVMGQTDAGRYLLSIIIGFPDGRGYPVTARQMTDNEQRRFKKWRDR